MYYTEFLRVRNAAMWLGITLVAITVGHAALHLFVPGINNQHGAGSGPTNFVSIFAIAALVIGGIMATIFGSTLARENDGHLEFAWTKPHSRTEYATTAMLVDAAGIMFCVLMGFVALVLSWYIPGMHEQVVWSFTPTGATDLLRFALFPLAWYGVIVALSARLAGGGLVQGLIWPVSIFLLILHQIPFSPAWHAIFTALNIVNPLSYVEVKDNFSTLGASDISVATFAIIALAVFAVGGWAVATMQWRRLQA